MYRKQKSFDGKVHLIDVTSPEFLHDPYRFYRERREVDKVIQIMRDSWSINSFDLTNKILMSSSFGRAEFEIPELITKENPMIKVIDDWMLLKNPPKHTRLRKLVLKAFTPKRVRELEPKMRNRMQVLVKEIKSKSSREFDLVSSISYPFPVGIISDMMGIPEEDHYLFRQWSTDFAYALAMDIMSLPDPMKHKINQSAIGLLKYFEEVIERKKNNLGKDLISTLIIAEEENSQLSTTEILSNCTLLLVAGHETTTSLISNGINLLLDHPTQFESLRSDSTLLDNAVDEILRYDPPVQSTGRLTLEDIEVDGYQFKKGEFVSLMLGGVGRDPDANSNPDKFDITREHINHVSFGKGIHYCLGVNLAKLEAKIALEAILSEFPRLERNGQAIRNPNWLLRGFKKLPVKY